MKTPTTLCYNKGIDILNNIKEGCPKLRIQMAKVNRRHGKIKLMPQMVYVIFIKATFIKYLIRLPDNL